MNGYHIECIKKGLVKIHEDVASYFLSEQEIEAAMQKLKENRSGYSTPLAYQRRMDFFEEALKIAQGGIS